MPEGELKNIIKEFQTIGLHEMDNVKLMNRVDTKFTMTIRQLMETLPALTEHYRVLEIDGNLSASYQSRYYDDRQLNFYMDHHRKRVDRFKVRYRKYVESDLAFLEVKHKNKGRTNKKRIQVDDMPNSNNITGDHSDFIKSTGVDYADLQHVLTNEFSRITFVGKKHNERLTFDLNLKFQIGDKSSELKNLVIAELKQERVNRTSPFYKMMKTSLIRPYRTSKYCIGIIHLYGKENVKYNRFKKKLIKLKKISTNVA
ncbi:MAG: polyphosphate polymerase domain-containing protein [Crocinitomicaceae bacterium]|nr:polyphosphate polymerase domain-containing protein [Crocinitomicaceae bacterium]